MTLLPDGQMLDMKLDGVVIPVSNVFNVPCHLVTARAHGLFRAEAFEAWRNAAGVAAEGLRLA